MEKTEEEKKSGRKMFITVWCAVDLTLIIVAAIVSAVVKFTLPEWLGGIGMLLASELLAYLGVNVWQKKIQKQSEEEK